MPICIQNGALAQLSHLAAVRLTATVASGCGSDAQKAKLHSRTMSMSSSHQGLLIVATPAVVRNSKVREHQCTMRFRLEGLFEDHLQCQSCRDISHREPVQINEHPTPHTYMGVCRDLARARIIRVSELTGFELKRFYWIMFENCIHMLKKFVCTHHNLHRLKIKLFEPSP